MLVVVNPAAGGGTALERWAAIASRVRAICGAFEVAVPTRRPLARDAMAGALDRGETVFVAAGGDGTVNLVLSNLLELAGDRLFDLTLGAVGLGSSNDFHKPFHPERRIGSIPCRLGAAEARPHDVGLLAWCAGERRLQWRPWIVNASIGITAEANRCYNATSGVPARLKRHATGLAMTWAALVGLLHAGVKDLTIESRDSSATAGSYRVRNLGIVKNPHFAGQLHYDSPHLPTSGDFGVHLLGDVGWSRLLAVLAGLAQGRFVGRTGTRSWRTSRLTIRGPVPFAVEVDGEVITTRSVEFSVLPVRIKLCG